MPERASCRPRVREIKGGLVRLAERLIHPIRLEQRDNATLESAREMELRGFFHRAANDYFTVLETSPDIRDRAEALIALGQQLINLGRLRQAEEALSSHSLVFGSLESQKEKDYFHARKFEKFGWISDYRGDFVGAKAMFLQARNLLPMERDEGEEDLYSTTTHFLGRAHLGLALQGVDRGNNSHQAMVYFEQDLARFESIREQGIPDPLREAMQHAWIARCLMVKDRLDEAETEVGRVQELFEELMPSNPDAAKGGLAHYHTLRGGILARRGENKAAREEFERAITIRSKGQRYPKGEAAAFFGIASTYLAQGNIGAALFYALRGLRTFPLAIVRPSI